MTIRKKFLKDESGVTIEYAVLASFIALAAIFAVTPVNDRIRNTFWNLAHYMTTPYNGSAEGGG
jgi:Flp pilus assembly pilin Flp